MAFECNLAAGNKAACQHHVSRQSVEYQQVLPELIRTLYAWKPMIKCLGTFNEPEGALKLQMLERLSYAAPESLPRKDPAFRELEDMLRAKTKVWK